MITKWRLFNFKSVRKDTELEFGPLTILAGANSSGKSTVIQSILLVSQTVSSKVASQSVVLNGPLVKLGQFDDIRSQGSNSDQIAIGWRFEANPNETDPQRYVSLDSDRAFISSDEPKVEFAEMLFSFDTKTDESRGEMAQLHPSLYSSELHAGFKNSNNEDRMVNLSVVRRTSPFSDPEVDSAKLDYLDLEYRITLDDTSIEELEHRYASAQPIGASTKHFYPLGLTLKYSLAKMRAKWFLTSLIERGFRPSTSRPDRDFVVPNQVLEVLKAYLGDEAHLLDKGLLETQGLLADLSEGVAFSALLAVIRQLPFEDRKSIRAKLDDERFPRDVFKAFLSSPNNKYLTARTRLPELSREAINYTHDYFSRGIKYLGPLRDEPKAMYPLTASMDPNDVGLRGEFTAAILDLHKDTMISYLPSELFQTPRIEKKVLNRRLQTAVTDWLNYLNVAEEVLTKDMGKLGHEMKIRTGGLLTPIDLTHVGVGVSQVLPILVSCLLAPADSTLIYEQPELHLHPTVQSRLGDFFLSMALLGKQCVIETHSEYLVHRLRFRAAAASSDQDYAALFKMYFVGRSEGVTSFKRVVVNEFGAILDWPDGFFDNSQKEAEDIIRFGMKKKQDKRNKG